MDRAITVNETWTHYYTPKTKRHSKQWIFPGRSSPNKAKTVPSPGKVIAKEVSKFNNNIFKRLIWSIVTAYFSDEYFSFVWKMVDCMGKEFRVLRGNPCLDIHH